ncbi:MAG: beta-propeller domain-containing protein [Patescibacteria group bacterium]
MFKKVFKLSFLFILSTLILSGCTFPWEKSRNAETVNQSEKSTVPTENESVKTNEIKKFKNDEELKNFLQSNTSERGMTVNREVFSSMTKNLSSLSMDSASASAVGSGSDYSTTNNQVFGVDEADIIKTDGKYIYAVVKNELLIINVTPADQTKEISRITFKSTPSDIFVSDDKLVVFGNDYRIYEKSITDSFKRRNGYIFFKVFDISNPAEPKETRSLDFEGNYVSARLIGNYVYFITNNYAYYSEGEPLTPRILENDKIISGGCGLGTGKCFSPEVFYFDAPYDNYNFTSVNSINISDPSELVGGQVYLINSGENIYVSTNNIYIANTEYISEYELEQEVKQENIFSKLEQAEQDKIKQIEAVASFILSKEEKAMKVANIVNHYFYSLDDTGRKAIQAEIDSALLNKIKARMKDLEKTVIYRIAIKAGKAEYQAKGEVQGKILNQFSMDENSGSLRLATTRNEMWSRLFTDSTKSYSNVYVLDENLRLVGSLENIATDEQIYSTRFMNNRVYIVTFKRTDPLYVIDLTNKTKPAILGAIKIPGFSTYLHPANEAGTKIIGFGRDAEEATDGGVKIKGLKLSLFDLTDLSKPKELSSYIIGNEYSDSVALNDHRAFLYSEGKNLISVPAVLREDGKLLFSGSLVFSIENDLLKLNGKINHLPANSSAISSWQSYNNNTVSRSLYVDSNLFTFSNKFLKINNLTDLSEVKSLILTPGQEDYIITPVVEPTIPAALPVETPASSTIDSSSAPASSTPASSTSSSTPANSTPATSTSTSATSTDMNP